METAPLGFLVKHYLGRAGGGTFNLQPDLHHLEVHFGGSDSFYPDETTLVGRLEANSSHIKGRIPVVGSFQIDQTQPGYVRVVAVDKSGNRSGPSEATVCTPRLIKDEYIDSLTVSKLTAGTLTADTILGASIRTASTGARVELNPAGLQAYDPAGVVTVDIESATGNATFTGTLQTRTDAAGIRFFADVDNLTNGVFSINDEDGTPTSHQFRMVGSYSPGSLWQMLQQLKVERTSDGVIDGGKLMLGKGATILSHQPNGQDETFLALGEYPFGPGGGSIYLQGKFHRGAALNGQAAVWCARDVVAAGNVGLTYSYGPTMSDFMCPVISLFSAGAPTPFCVDLDTATSFSIGWGDSLAHHVYVWAFRMES